MKEFERYESLSLIRENNEAELDIYRVATSGQRFVVTEKIHGANFEVATDGDVVRFARRSGVLGEGDSFYGYEYVKVVLAERITAMYKDIKEMVVAQHEACDTLEAQGEPCNRPEYARDFSTLTIRGELAGGNYPHKDAPKVKVGHGQVGKGTIWYSQDKSFYAFDVTIDGIHLDHYQMATLCKSFGIPLAPVLFYGDFQECLEWSKEHLNDNTVVPTMQPMLNEKGEPIMEGDFFVHLPEIEGNTREGHVISAVYPSRLPNGKPMIFKHKGDKFLENKGSKSPKAKVEVKFTQEQQTVFNAVLPLLTEQRLEAVQSKEPLFEPKDFPRACGLVVQDAIDDLFPNNPMANLNEKGAASCWCSLNTKERKQVTKQLLRECANRLRVVFFK